MLFIKILHMISGAAVIILYVIMALLMLTPQVSTPRVRYALKIAQHTAYTAVILLGIIQIVNLWPNVPTWVWLKIICFIIALWATYKAQHATSVRALAYWLMVGGAAYVGVIWLVAVQPNLSNHQIENQPVSSSSSSLSSGSSSDGSGSATTTGSNASAAAGRSSSH